ncbi:MAG: hypothetical protein M3Q63_04020 [bacterium]|nr:hypothetical protein [bacterium]
MRGNKLMLRRQLLFKPSHCEKLRKFFTSRNFPVEPSLEVHLKEMEAKKGISVPTGTTLRSLRSAYHRKAPLGVNPALYKNALMEAILYLDEELKKEGVILL